MGCGLPVGDTSWTESRAPRILAPSTSPEARVFEEQAEAARRAAERFPSFMREVSLDEIEAARFAMPRSQIPSTVALPAGWAHRRAVSVDMMAAAGLPLVHIRPQPLLDAGFTGPEVDIYLSAGPSVGYGASDVAGSTAWDPSDYSGCNRDEPRNCSIWRVRLRLGFSTPLAVERVVSSFVSFGGRKGDIQYIRTGASMPALSPDGRYLAYRRRNYSEVYIPASGRSSEESAIVVRDLHHGTEIVVDSSNHRSESLRFPEFYDDGRLLYARGTEQKGVAVGGTMYAVDLDRHAGTAGTPIPLLGAETALLGAGSERYAETAFDNPRVRPSGRTASLAGSEIVSFGRNDQSGDACGTAAKAMPRIHSTSRGGTTRFGCFDPELSGQTIKSCQHPQWSLDGNAIYCWLNDPPTPLGRTGDAIYLQTTYRYESAAGAYQWALSTDQRAFQELSASELQRFSSLFPPGTTSGGAAPDCKYTIYKHAGECGSSNFMIMTLFCTDNVYNRYNENSDIFVSRVLLVRKEPIAYWDITGMIEHDQHLSEGSLQGIYSACRTVEGG